MKEITASELRQKISSGEKIALVDVREEYEHEDFNIGGINIPLGEITFSPEKFKEWVDQDIILYCRSGNRSSMAQQLLASKLNIHNTVNLIGGLNAWREELKK